MSLSTTSILSSLVFCSFSTLFIWFLLKNTYVIKYLGKYIYFLLLLIIVRVLLPFELPFTITFVSKNILPAFRNILLFPINGTLSLYKILLFVWFLGIIIKLYIFIKNQYYSYKMIRYCPNYNKSDISPIIADICQNYSHNKHFLVIHFPAINTPAIIGIIKPKILMPDTDFSEKELFFILSHEISHYYKKDLHINFFVKSYALFTGGILSC